MRLKQFALLGISVPCCLMAWEDHPDRDRNFDPDKTIPSSGNSSDHYRSDDSGRDYSCDSCCREYREGIVLDGPDRDK